MHARPCCAAHPCHCVCVCCAWMISFSLCVLCLDDSLRLELLEKKFAAGDGSPKAGDGGGAAGLSGFMSSLGAVRLPSSSVLCSGHGARERRVPCYCCSALCFCYWCSTASASSSPSASASTCRSAFVTRSNRTTTCTQAPGAERAGAGAVNMFTGDSSGSVALAAGKWKSKAGGR